MTLSDLLLLPVPISRVLSYMMHAGLIWVFLTAAVAIVLLANLIRRGTEQMAKRAGPAIGGLLNVTFGSVAELVLCEEDHRTVFGRVSNHRQ